jgi:hypothetical protein
MADIQRSSLQGGRRCLNNLASGEVYLGIMQELYRVCCNDALIAIIVPHPRHDDFLSDPTHVRAVTPLGLALFSQAQNRDWLAQGAANTPLGIYLGVDFATQSITVSLDEPWRGRHNRGEISSAALNEQCATTTTSSNRSKLYCAQLNLPVALVERLNKLRIWQHRNQIYPALCFSDVTACVRLWPFPVR